MANNAKYKYFPLLDNLSLLLSSNLILDKIYKLKIAKKLAIGFAEWKNKVIPDKNPGVIIYNINAIQEAKREDV